RGPQGRIRLASLSFSLTALPRWFGFDVGDRDGLLFDDAARCVLGCYLEEALLTSHAGRPWFRHYPSPGRVRKQLPCFCVVGERRGKDFAKQPLLQIRLLNRKYHFDTPAQVPIHPIGRTYVNLGVA